jgi:anti-sigma B factor antagonist
MQIRIEQSADHIRLIPQGQIDHDGSDALKTAFGGLPLTSQSKVVLDFREVTYIGSAGLGKLLLFYKRLAALKAEMRIEGAPAAIQALLKELRMDTLFSIS